MDWAGTSRKPRFIRLVKTRKMAPVFSKLACGALSAAITLSEIELAMVRSYRLQEEQDSQGNTNGPIPNLGATQATVDVDVSGEVVGVPTSADHPAPAKFASLVEKTSQAEEGGKRKLETCTKEHFSGLLYQSEKDAKKLYANVKKKYLDNEQFCKGENLYHVCGWNGKPSMKPSLCEIQKAHIEHVHWAVVLCDDVMNVAAEFLLKAEKHAHKEAVTHSKEVKRTSNCHKTPEPVELTITGMLTHGTQQDNTLVELAQVKGLHVKLEFGPNKFLGWEIKKDLECEEDGKSEWDC